MKLLHLIFLTFLFQGMTGWLPAQESVKVWEEPLTLPTYLVKPPDKNPMFFRNQSYQGASRYIYPYALEDNPTNEKIDKTYKALYLENEYIKLCVLPEIGGRLFYATDKTNGYEIFYRQHVIKPANIGMVGAWISGGVEFCVFHHHRASTNLPVDYRLVNNADGSSTIWIGETEPRHRMKWSLGISLYPGKSYIEVDGRLMNPTENINSILYWANVATHVNEDYQVIFPPSTDFAVYHAKNSFAHWPVTSEVYNGKEHYENHIDASWWKNHPDPISMFAHDIKHGFLAGYDHGKQAGTMHVGNHHIVKGAKLWEWGPGPYGSMWDTKVLTDSDGPYAELMTGAYSDNQPDYSWLKPYEYKTFQQYWYPIRSTGGATAANLSGTINLKKEESGEFLVAANTTQAYENAHIVLRNDDKVFFETNTSISPDKPFAQHVRVGDVDEYSLNLSLSVNGKELIAYRPVKKDTDLPLPKPVEPPRSPEEIESVEELYLTGLRIRQFHNARIDAQAYFEEALKRDPMDVRSNTMMGIILKEDLMLEDAARYLRTAIKRLTANYTRPRDCEALYHLGIILKWQKKYEAAYDTLYRAAWDQNFASAAYFHLAQISVLRGNDGTALTEIDRSLSYNSSNLPALNLKTSVLRRLGKNQAAAEIAEFVLTKDPLNSYALNEEVLMGRKNSQDLVALLRNEPESYLELATQYMNSGLNDDAFNILEKAGNAEVPALKNYPTIHYYLGYLYLRKKDKDKAVAHFKKGQELPTDYCFPFRRETADILKYALSMDPGDSRAYYYLGNIFYDRQPAFAINAWESAINHEPDLAIAHRNLGWGYQQFYQDTDKAIAAYEKALEFNQEEPRYFYELDKLYEKSGAGIDKRRQLFEGNHEVVSQRPDAFLQEIQVLLLAGKSGRAIEYLRSQFFPRQEGVDNLHGMYVDACLTKGLSEYESGNWQSALKYFQMADEYPENHQIARNPNYGGNAQIFYLQGKAYEKLGKKKTAKQLYEKIAAMELRSPENMYYQALANQALGYKVAAVTLGEKIEREGVALAFEEAEVDFFSKFGEGESLKERQSKGYHLLGLYQMILGDEKKATEYLDKACTLDPNNLWAKVHLKNM